MEFLFSSGAHYRIMYYFFVSNQINIYYTVIGRIFLNEGGEFIYVLKIIRFLGVRNKFAFYYWVLHFIIGLQLGFSHVIWKITNITLINHRVNAHSAVVVADCGKSLTLCNVWVYVNCESFDFQNKGSKLL